MPEITGGSGAIALALAAGWLAVLVARPPSGIRAILALAFFETALATSTLTAAYVFAGGQAAAGALAGLLTGAAGSAGFRRALAVRRLNADAGKTQ